jgi:hypothetical protein
MARSKAGSPKKRPQSRVKKISITVDERVLRNVERTARRAGRTLSAHVTEALERDLRRTRLRELIETHEAEYGEISEEELAAVRAECRV